MTGLTILFWRSASTHAAQATTPEIRQATVRDLTLGTPDDLNRLQADYEKIEQELAKLELNLPLEGFEPLKEKRQQLKGLQDRLGEAEAVARMLDLRRDKATANSSPLQSEIADRMKALQDAIAILEKEIQSDRAAHLRTLLDERQGLARLLSAQQSEWLSEYVKLSDCQSADQRCLHNRLRTLCRLKSLVSEAEQLSLHRLIAEAGGSTPCEETD